MKRTVKLGWSNLKVGIVLAIAIAATIWASLSGSSKTFFTPKSDFECYFANVNGMLPGSPVWLAGVHVGNVKSVEFANLDTLRQVRVVCSVVESAWPLITEGTTVQVGTIGLVGDKYVEIVPGPPSARQLPRGATIPPAEVGSAPRMFKAGEEAINDVRSLVTNLDGVMGRMNRGEGTIGRMMAEDALYNDLTMLIGNLTELTAALQQNQERLVTSLEKTANSVSELSGQVSTNTGTLGKVINDPALYDNLTATSARLDTIMSKIDRAEGSMGLLVNDTALYVEVVDLVDRVNNLVTDIQRDPRKYFKFSVF